MIFSPPGLLLDIEPKSHNNPFPHSFTGALTVNNLLSKAEKLFTNVIEGPESIAIFNGTVMTSSKDGYIYRIDGQNGGISRLIKIIDRSCQSWNQSLCSRPLGMRFDTNGVLYVVEAFFGIYSVSDILSKEPNVEHILSYEETEVLDKRSKMFDDFVIDETTGLNGGHVLYISDMSTKFDLSEYMIIAGASETGRILRYDINAKKLDIVLENVFTPNGIDLSHDKEFLVFAESILRRVSKHYIRGTKKGQTLPLIEGLAGEPDNIRRTENRTFWVALFTARTQQNRLLMDWTEDKPWIRKLFFRTLHLIGSAVQSIGHWFECQSVANSGFALKTGLSEVFIGRQLKHTHGMAIELDESGHIVRCLHSPEGAVTLLSEVSAVEEHNRTVLYLGSFYNKYLGKLILQ